MRYWAADSRDTTDSCRASASAERLETRRENMLSGGPSIDSSDPVRATRIASLDTTHESRAAGQRGHDNAIVSETTMSLRVRMTSLALAVAGALSVPLGTLLAIILVDVAKAPILLCPVHARATLDQIQRDLEVWAAHPAGA